MLVMLMKQDIDVYKLGGLLALYTGVRIGELCALRRGDIEDRCISVRSTIQRLQKTGGGTELIIHNITEKGDCSIRTIAFSLRYVHIFLFCQF